MKTIKIAVIADYRGFREFIRDIETYEDKKLPYAIKFIHIDDEQKCRGMEFSTYIIHRSGHLLKNLQDIEARIKTRIVEIR
jgi:hypothetical protein